MMPYLLLRPHRRARPAAVMLALLAVLLATLAACASTGTRPVPADAVQLNGAGSTFDAPFFTTAFNAYQQAHSDVAISYAAVGSSLGITRFDAGQVNFGATDVPASTADLAADHAGPALQVPVDLGAVAVSYNVQMLGASRLRLTGPVLARIFLGQITKWDDPAITALNPGATLPDTYITVVHRSDGSGTTYIFSNYLSAVSPAWASHVGTGRALRWPTGVGGNGNPGVAADIEHTPDSIGYVETSYANGIADGFAAIANRDGDYVTPDPAAISADAAGKPSITANDFSIVNEPGKAAYPISGYSWVLVSARQSGQRAGKALVSLLSWLTHAGQSYAASLGYVPLPPAIQQLAAATLDRVTGPAGTPLAS